MQSNYILQVMITMALLGITLYVLYRSTNALQRKRYSGDIAILDRRVIDANSSLLLVSVKNKQYFIGIGGKDLKVLDVFS
jgi:flagellar biogenesis protein FliO